MFNVQSRKEYINPYRHGVLIGNFVEDIYGKDLVKKYASEKTYANYLSECHDKYKNPKLVPNKNINLKYEGGMKPNFDLNIDFSIKTIADIRDQIEKRDKEILENNKTNEFKLNDESQIEENSDVNNQSIQNISKKKDPFIITQRDTIMSNYKDMSCDLKKNIGDQVESFVKKDLVGLYYTTKSGLVNNLLRGHGPDQSKFNSNEYISVKG